MKKTSIVVLFITAISMVAMNLLSNNLSFVTYLILAFLPILLGAIYIAKEKNNGMVYNFGNSLFDSIIYTIVYGVGSYFLYEKGGYDKIAKNSFEIGTENIQIGSVEGFALTDLLLPFLVSLIVFYLAGRKSNRNERIK